MKHWRSHGNDGKNYVKVKGFGDEEATPQPRARCYSLGGLASGEVGMPRGAYGKVAG
jgi:hypothetical protein